MPSPPGRLAAATATAATTSSGNELPSQQVRTVPDPEEHLFQDFAALIGGLTREPVEEVERSVVAERAGAEGAYVSLAIDRDAASSQTQ